MPSYVLTVAYTVESAEAHTALINAIVTALNDAPSELALTQATVVDDTGTVEDLLGPEGDTSSASSQESVGAETVGDQPVAATPQGDEISGGAESLPPPSDPEHPDEPASEGLPTGKEF